MNVCVCIWLNEMLICYHLGFIGERSRVGNLISVKKEKALWYKWITMYGYSE
jgi:hypothetical protein